MQKIDKGECVLYNITRGIVMEENTIDEHIKQINLRLKRIEDKIDFLVSQNRNKNTVSRVSKRFSDPNMTKGWKNQMLRGYFPNIKIDIDDSNDDDDDDENSGGIAPKQGE
tara:strand:- start:3171 stop:3503 length:333 start_codon:yes stop_codon:yes gene_type:complete